MGGKRRRLMVARAWEYLMEFPMAKVIRKPVIKKEKILCGYNNRYVKLSSIFKKEIGKKKIIFLCLGCGGSTDEKRSELVIEFGSELLLEKSLDEEILLGEEDKEEEEEEEEEDEECVDKRAEEFIERFYKKIRLERQQSLENSISSVIT